MSSLLNRASVRATTAIRPTHIRSFNSATLSPVLQYSSSAVTSSSHATSEDAITTTALGRIGSYISDLIPSIVFASVPKSKTSHSKKRMRQATKGLKEQKNIVQCPGCGQAKLMHHLCTHCYKDMKGRGPNSSSKAIPEVDA
ncbi:hypothetical protein BG004_004591 [Podila humilis]|nr:hypothetical protein BG004_004591 [Podila humilis]